MSKEASSPATKRNERPSSSDDNMAPPDSKRVDDIKTLIIPAVSVGNVGQIAVDFLCKAFSKSKPVHVDHEGNLLPCVGRVGTKTDSRITTALEFHTLNENVSCLQIRSMVVPGKSRSMAQLILKFAVERGFTRVLMVGGASALALIDEHQLLQTRSLPRVWGMDAVVSKEFIELEYDITELKLAGLLPFVVQEASNHPVKLAGLVTFVFEGDNIPDGQRIALAVAKALNL